ncbi:hypothetical protein [Noviherbaspirillum galbum]|uniref:Uncharacterized protein n=1 Tax=Noviherbaspirillum galbum TaxID=2709383 RepID=A0A6B3SH04_9BURK|nr:hypothetical protein [Noviherbaspirillum galbum]NEX60131.1 hypothetical protein [Noviherbaspirillum galbum]
MSNHDNTPQHWWKDDQGIYWPPFLRELVWTDAHRARLHERARLIGEPQTAACALELEHQVRPITTYFELKDAFDRIEQLDYDLGPALEMAADLFGDIPQEVAATEIVMPTRTLSMVEEARAAAEAALRRAMMQRAVPTKVDECRDQIRKMLGIRRRRAPGAGD